MTVQERKAGAQRGRRKPAGKEQAAKTAQVVPGHGDEVPKAVTSKPSSGADPSLRGSPDKESAPSRRRGRGGARRNKGSVAAADAVSTVVEADGDEGAGGADTTRVGESPQPIQRAAEIAEQTCTGAATRDGSSSSEDDSPGTLLAFPPGLPPGLTPVGTSGLPKTLPPSLPPSLPPGLEKGESPGFDFEFSRHDETEELASASECTGLVLAKGFGRENSATCSTTASGASSPRTVGQAAVRISGAHATKPSEEAAASSDKVEVTAVATPSPAPASNAAAVMRLIARVQHAWLSEDGCASSQLSVNAGEFLYTWPNSRTAFGWIYAERPIGSSGEKSAGWLPMAALQNLGPHHCWARVKRTSPPVHPSYISVTEGDAVLVDTRSLQGALQSGVAFVERPADSLRCGGAGWVPYPCLDWF
mmetsp:Transcript_146670/g.254018  ORF Transcript_146670/g.254018 Transcript_146670/m.254018 type:complete len:419 (+) Transcript_146670:81-1337(+)